MGNQWWDQFGKNSRSLKKPKSNKFIEALRQASKAPSEIKKLESKKKVLEKRYQERVLFHINRIKREEREIYNREKRKTQEEIQLLQEKIRQELESLKQETKQLDKQLEIAAEQNIVNPGIYDVSFLQKLINWIRLFRAKIEDATIWLSAWNQKSKKRGAFWSMFTSKKGGAKFLLSSEHYIVRSTG